MKILFLSHYPHQFGANRSLLTLVKGLHDKGVQVQVWCNEEGDFPAQLRAWNINVRIFPYHNWAATFLHPSYFLLPYAAYRNAQLLPALVEEAKQFNPNIIHTNSSVLGIGAQMALKMNKPHVWHLREFPWKQYRKVFFPSRNILNKYLKEAKKVICVSQAIKKEMGKGHDLNKWEVVYNGVLDSQKSVVNKEVTSTETFTFIIVGLLHPAKNQAQAIRAFAKIAAQYPQVTLKIVGEGQTLYTKKLKGLVRRFRLLDRIEFTGFVKNMDRIYQEADALLICSLDEGMGRVTVEAMTYQLPVIGYRGGATPELIADGVDGFLYDNTSGLATYMEKLLKDRERAKRMGEVGRAKALQQFSTQLYIDQMYDVFSEIFPF